MSCCVGWEERSKIKLALGERGCNCCVALLCRSQRLPRVGLYIDLNTNHGLLSLSRD
jgi:hypothetical protein